MQTKPQCLIDAMQPNARADAFYSAFQARMKKQAKRYNRLKSVRAALPLSQFIDTRRTRLKCDGSINDLENEMRECVDMSYFFEYRADTLRNVEESDIAEMIAYACPDMPARVVNEYREDIEDDIIRAMCSAAENDYSAQFGQWLPDRIEDAINESLPDGAVWAFGDVNGNAGAWYESEYVLVAMPHRVAVAMFGKDGELSDDLDENIRDNAATVNPCDFDDRGEVYGSPDAWPEHFADFATFAESWQTKRDTMRARLREMIRNRAPLETRAELVATVYGIAGSVVND